MSDFPYQLTFDQRDNFLHAVVTGPNTANTVFRYMDDVRSECERRDCYRVLIEEKLDGPRFDEMEIFALIDEGSGIALGFFDAIAYIDEQQEFELARFAETVAVNRGIPIAVFSSVADAENWLRNHGRPDDGHRIFTGDGGG